MSQTCFDRAAQGQPQKQKHLPKVVLEKICSEKIQKFHRKETLMKSFLKYFKPLRFLRTPIQVFSYDIRGVLENTSEQLFKEIANKRKTE